MAWMRCVSGSLLSLSASTRLKGRDNPRLLDQSRLLPLDPHIRPKNALPLNPQFLSLCRGIDTSPLPWLRKRCGTLSQSRPACDFAVLKPCPVLTAVLHRSCFSLCLTPLSSVWVANVRPAVVLFYDPALLVLRLIWLPSVLCRTTTATEHHLYLIVSQSLDLISCLRFPTIITLSSCVQPRPLLLSVYRMCILLFCL